MPFTVRTSVRVERRTARIEKQNVRRQRLRWRVSLQRRRLRRHHPPPHPGPRHIPETPRSASIQCRGECPHTRNKKGCRTRDSGSLAFLPRLDERTALLLVRLVVPHELARDPQEGVCSPRCTT